MLAAASALAIRGHDWSSRWEKLDGFFVILSYLAGATSYYGIYIAYVAMLEMIDQKVLGAMNPRLQTGLAIQFYGTIVGFLLLGLVFARMLEQRTAVGASKPKH
jgi:hypothetical protein